MQYNIFFINMQQIDFFAPKFGRKFFQVGTYIETEKFLGVPVFCLKNLVENFFMIRNVGKLKSF